MNLEQIQQKRRELLAEIKAIEIDLQNPNSVMLLINKYTLQRELLSDMAETAFDIDNIKDDNL